jgi:hypothetical protein
MNTKKQHYVSQLLLNSWDCGEGKNKKINIFDIKKSEVRPNQSIKKVFSENYFYDRDNLVENFLANLIEGPASSVIDKIISESRNIISEKELLTLYRFILTLSFRTPGAINKVSEFINSHLESIVRECLSLNGFDPEEASNGKFEFNQSHLVSTITLMGAQLAPLLKDLKYHIIKNETSSDFYISDHPVFIYNWLYRELNHPAVTSLAARGLQIFLPLSPKITLCLYDPKVYYYGKQGDLETCISNNNDIEILNSFQVINSDSTIGFNSREDEAHLRQLYEKYKNIKLHHHESGILSTTKEGNRKIRSMHWVFTRQTKLKEMPSFIKFRGNSKGYARSYQERDPELAKRISYLMYDQKQRSIVELDQDRNY